LHLLGGSAAVSGIDDKNTVVAGLNGDIAAGADNHPDVVANGKCADCSIIRIGIINFLLRIVDRCPQW